MTASVRLLGATRHHHQPDVTKRSMSSARQRLVTMAQNQVFGTIHDLSFRAGDPVFDPPPRIIRRVKLGGHNTARPQAVADNFTLKQEWVEFFAHLDVFENGAVLVIEITHGLPMFFEFEQPPSM